MPEGDAVHRTARRLDRALSGALLTRTDFRVPALATIDLAGRRVVRTVARGKHLLTRIDGDPAWTLHTHLKMEGSWRVYPSGARWDRPAHQARVALETSGQQAVGFLLGIVELVPTREEDALLEHLGPDPLGPDWDEAEALRRLREQPDRSLVEALLDQRNLAGIGNMWASELCFVSGVRPTTPVARVRDLPRVVRRARQLLEQNVRRATPAATGNLREPFWVYRRDRSACRRCGTPIEVGMLGPAGRERAAYWCPHCQP